MSSYRGGAGRSITGRSSQGAPTRRANQQGSQNRSQGNQGNRQSGGQPPGQSNILINAGFLREPVIKLTAPIRQALEHFKATLRLDVGPGGTAVVVVANQLIPGWESREVPTLEDLSRMSAIAAFVNNAKKDSVSSETKLQLMSDAFRLHIKAPANLRVQFRSGTLDASECATITQDLQLLKILNENLATVRSNQGTGLPGLKDLITEDIVRIKNALVKHFYAIMLDADNNKEITMKSISFKAGVSEWAYSRFTKKIAVKNSDDLISIFFPKSDWISSGFSLTVREIRDANVLYPERYGCLVTHSAVLIAMIRDDKFLRSVCFLNEDFDFSNESEISTRLNKKVVFMVPLFSLGEVAKLIATEKTGGYLNRWSQKPNTLDPILGVSALNHFFLKFRLLQVAPDVTTAFGDIFDKRDEFVSRVREKPFTTGDNIGHWMTRSIVDDATTSTDLYDEFGTVNSSADQDSQSLLYRYMIMDLAVLEGHKFADVLKSFLSLVRNDKGEIVPATTEVVIKQGDDERKDTVAIQPNYDLKVVDDAKLGNDKIQVDRDWAHDAEIGNPANVAPAAGTPEELFRKQFFSDTLGSLDKQESFKPSANDLTRPTAVTISFVKDFGRKNRQLTTRLLQWLVGFSSEAVQNYATRILVARQNLLAGDELFTAFEEDTPGPDGFQGNDDGNEFVLNY